jgi:hypothetical protein
MVVHGFDDRATLVRGPVGVQRTFDDVLGVAALPLRK